MQPATTEKITDYMTREQGIVFAIEHLGTYVETFKKLETLKNFTMGRFMSILTSVPRDHITTRRIKNNLYRPFVEGFMDTIINFSGTTLTYKQVYIWAKQGGKLHIVTGTGSYTKCGRHQRFVRGTDWVPVETLKECFCELCLKKA